MTNQIIMLRRPEVEKRTGKARTTIYRDIQEGLLTRPVSTGANSVAWPDFEIDQINRAWMAGRSDDQIRQLVDELHRKRVTD